MGDTYRPGRQRSLAERVTFTAGGGDNYDSYRPGPPTGPRGAARNHSEFTFSAGRQGPQFPPVGPDSSQPRRSNRHRGGSANGRGSSRSNNRSSQRSDQGRRDHKGHGRGGQRRPFPFRKQAPHERALLQTQDLDGASPERTLGVTGGVNRFHNLEDLSESESEGMDLEGGDDAGDDTSAEDNQPKHKLARVQTDDRADGDSVPKWSNPDPYTVLPPPSETTGKKRDFVQLIRKAKNQAVEKAEAENAVAANDDFISFGDEEEEEEVKEKIPPPPKGERPPEPQPPPPPPVPFSFRPQHVPISGSLNDISGPGLSSSVKRDAAAAGLPERPQHATERRADRRSAKRKRNEFLGGITGEWLPRPHIDSTPWCRNTEYGAKILEKGKGKSDYDKMLMLLHNEIYDFFDYVEPHEHDHKVRTRLIKQIENVIGGRNVVLPDHCRVLAFGSFPAKLYLPTADMDIVLASDQHLRGGQRTIDFDIASRGKITKTLWAACRKLQAARLVTQHQVITRAKVPIIKYVDRESGIKIDLSFENLSGVVAQDTYAKWNAENDLLAPFVLLVKQFLVMRGLSDVHTGGLGGFSIVCLVYHFLYHHQPELQKEGGIINIGKLFMGFLYFWGHTFDTATQRIQMAPTPTILRKQEIGIDGRPEKADGLSIEDPNNPSNNISGGSHRAHFVLKQFGEAWDALDARLNALDLSGTSILETILGGNYESYDIQRQTMMSLAE